jgi:hypothetical protein
MAESDRSKHYLHTASESANFEARSPHSWGKKPSPAADSPHLGFSAGDSATARKSRVAVQSVPEVFYYGGTGDCDTGRKPSRTGHKQALADVADTTIMWLPDQAMARGKP